MLPVLYNAKEFQHLPIKQRRKAAWEARQRAMRHWQFWCALGLLCGSTVIGSFISRHWFGDEPNGSIGAVCGFVLGMAWYESTLFRIGMPYYREILSQAENRVAKPAATSDGEKSPN